MPLTHSPEVTNALVQRVAAMKLQGFNAARKAVLPQLYKDVYGIDLNTRCGLCETEGYNALIKWAQKNS
jgi:hypothetical protein